jgi:hypothetical protein
MRRWKRGGRMPCRRGRRATGGQRHERARRGRASSACGTRSVPIRATPTSCTTRC